MRLPSGTPRFTVPASLVKILDRDLAFAGIAERDDRGRTLDVHSLRTTFGTLLSRGGVPLRTAQEAMRHSDPSLTANVYTDPKLLDVAGAMDALPELPLGGAPGTPESDRARATGTDGGRGFVAPTVAPTWCNERQFVAIHDNVIAFHQDRAEPREVSASPDSGKAKAKVTTPGNVSSSERAMGIEPTTFSLGS